MSLMGGKKHFYSGNPGRKSLTIAVNSSKSNFKRSSPSDPKQYPITKLNCDTMEVNCTT